jgi:hypothetical protein
MPTHDHDTADLHGRVRTALGAEHWKLVLELLEAVEKRWADNLASDSWALIDGIAAHFPGQAPAIRAVGTHLWETGDLDSDCGVTRPEGRPLGGSAASAPCPSTAARPPDRPPLHL